jgi:hypothetical protein
MWFGVMGAIIRSLWALDLFEEGQYLGKFFWGIMLFLLVVFIERLRSEKTLSEITFIAIILTTIFLTLETIVIVKGLEEGSDYVFAADLAFDLLGAGVFLIGFIIHLSMAKRSTSEKITIIQTIAMGVLFLGFCEQIIVNDIIGSSALIGNIIQAIGLFTYLSTYLIDWSYRFLVPVDVHHLLIIGRGGTCLGLKSFKVKNAKINAMRPFLVACAYEALKNIFLESTGAERPVETMTSGDRCVLMQYSPLTMVVMVVESPSYHFRISLKAFQDEFEQKNKGARWVNWNSLTTIEYEEALYNNFPYLKNLEVLETDEELI